jgi:hypothetical protein
VRRIVLILVGFGVVAAAASIAAAATGGSQMTSPNISSSISRVR